MFWKKVKAYWLKFASRAYLQEPVRSAVRPFVRLRTPQKWAFIVGCYNSGTTITRHLVGAHPDIRTLPREGVRFTAVLRRPEELGWSRMWLRCIDEMRMPEGVHPQLAGRVMKDWSPWWGQGGSVFLEKSIANILRLRWLQDNFPNAHFIGIVRNGYCVAEGVRRKAPPRGAAALEYGRRYPLELAASQWVRAAEILQTEGPQLRNYHQIRYEDLVENPEKALKGIWAFLGLAAPEMHVAGSALTIAGQSFAVRDMNPESMSRLNAGEQRSITPLMTGQLQRLGYPLAD